MLGGTSLTLCYWGDGPGQPPGFLGRDFASGLLPNDYECVVNLFPTESDKASGEC
jgi:hypothetical protein